MNGALEIGEVAEQYLSEGKYQLALDKFKSALEVLVPLLAKEPAGRRRDLLHKQVGRNANNRLFTETDSICTGSTVDEGG